MSWWARGKPWISPLQSLRKRGRLVFIGYSEDQLIANPLLLVIGELQILASGGQYSAGSARCRGPGQ